MSVTDELLANNEAYAASFDKADLPLPPAKKLAVVACMDARLNVYGILGLQEGDAHVIRNAGGVVTDDEIRSLAISQRLLGTEEILLIHHTGCGMLTFTDDQFKADIEKDTGIRPAWAAEAFPDLDGDVRQSIARIKASPFIPTRIGPGVRLRGRARAPARGFLAAGAGNATIGARPRRVDPVPWRGETRTDRAVSPAGPCSRARRPGRARWRWPAPSRSSCVPPGPRTASRSRCPLPPRSAPTSSAWSTSGRA